VEHKHIFFNITEVNF